MFDDEEPTRPDLPDSVRAGKNVAAIKPKMDTSGYSFNLSHTEGEDTKPPIKLVTKKKPPDRGTPGQTSERGNE